MTLDESTMNRNGTIFTLFFVLLTLSCGSKTEGDSCAKVHHLEIVSGNFQSGFHGETLEPIVIRIGDVNIQTVDPLTGTPYEETVTGNNAGPDQSRPIAICP